jgi:hypothetical protein
MAKSKPKRVVKKRASRKIEDGRWDIIAAFLVLVTAMFSPRIASALAVVSLLLMAIYKYNKK